MIGGTLRARSTASAVTAAAGLALGIAAFARFGFSGKAFLVAFICVVLVTLAAIDIDQHRIPNMIVLPASIVVLIGQLLRSPSHATGFLAYGVGAAAVL